MAKVNLDDPKVYKKYDPEGMREHIKGLPAQCQKAWQAAMDFSLPPHYANVDKVVILGMGGSAIGGDLVRSLIQSECKIPIIVRSAPLCRCQDAGDRLQLFRQYRRDALSLRSSAGFGV
jgi:glucosamine 6-phosphate synthetase-like amidotransferase/phosphosugar isomerase protein